MLAARHDDDDDLIIKKINLLFTTSDLEYSEHMN